MVFADILGGFATLFSDPYAIWFVFLAAFVGIVLEHCLASLRQLQSQ